MENKKKLIEKIREKKRLEAQMSNQTIPQKKNEVVASAGKPKPIKENKIVAVKHEVEQKKLEVPKKHDTKKAKPDKNEIKD